MPKWNFETIRITNREDHISYHLVAAGEDADFTTYPNTGYGCEWTLIEQTPEMTKNYSHYSVLLDDIVAQDVPQCGTEAKWAEVSERNGETTVYCDVHALLSIANWLEDPNHESLDGTVRIEV